MGFFYAVVLYVPAMAGKRNERKYKAGFGCGKYKIRLGAVRIICSMITECQTINAIIAEGLDDRCCNASRYGQLSHCILWIIG